MFVTQRVSLSPGSLVVLVAAAAPGTQGHNVVSWVMRDRDRARIEREDVSLKLTVDVDLHVDPVALADDVGGDAAVEPRVVSAHRVQPQLGASGDLLMKSDIDMTHTHASHLEPGNAAAVCLDVLVPADGGGGVGVHLAVQHQGVPALDQGRGGRGRGGDRHVGNN